jgi:energy-coupling factor transporter ATP-binding protein EcfA2
MRIERIHVEEGFLDRLNLQLGEGLNVLIGPRGAGKTSVIELLRFCLGAPGFSDKSGTHAREHALSVLGSGLVTVNMIVDDEQVTITRSATDAEPRATALFPTPLIFSQNEIEGIGLHAGSRLRLLDEFRSDRESTSEQRSSLRAEVRSLTSEIRQANAEIAHLEEQLQERTSVQEQLSGAVREQEEFVVTLGDSQGRWGEIDQLNSSAAEFAVREAVFDRVSRELSSWQKQLNTVVRSAPVVEDWPTAAGGLDPLAPSRAVVAGSVQKLQTAAAALEGVLRSISDLRENNRGEQVQVEEKSRILRRELELLQKGGSAVSKRISTLKEQLGNLDALAPLLDKRRDSRRRLVARRNALLDELDSICEGEYKKRVEIAERLNNLLGPSIRISVERFGIQTDYVNAIRNALRGTGIHYNTLAPLLAERMSPREVLEAVEDQDPQAIADVAGIPIDRAARLISELGRVGAEELVTCELQDSVTFSLLDGGQYKTTEHLSTGQRCTVILPLLLAKEDTVLIVDQPEDHLDNGFIVGTAIKAIRKRKEIGQLLFSTHNPNIPVLGEASQVVLMGSDGQHGFIRHSGPLDHPQSVDAITTVMEGGLEAFHRRAEFYGDSGTPA